MGESIFPDIQELVPHRSRALLVRDIKEFDREEKRITVRLEIKPEDILDGHFPDPLPKLYRGVDLVECGAIAGAALVKLLNPKLPENSLSLFKKIMDVEFFGLVSVGDTITMKVVLERYRLKTYIFSFTASNQKGDTVVAGKIMGMMGSAG